MRMRGYGSWRAHRIRAIRVPAAPTQRCHRRVSEETAILGSVNSTPSALPFEVLRATSLQVDRSSGLISNPATKAVQTSATVACSTVVVIRVSDSCGNFTDYTYA